MEYMLAWLVFFSPSDDSLGGDLFWSLGLHLYSPLPFRPGGLAERFRTHVFVTAGNLTEFSQGKFKLLLQWTGALSVLGSTNKMKHLASRWEKVTFWVSKPLILRPTGPLAKNVNLLIGPQAGNQTFEAAVQVQCLVNWATKAVSESDRLAGTADWPYIHVYTSVLKFILLNIARKTVDGKNRITREERQMVLRRWDRVVGWNSEIWIELLSTGMEFTDR